MTDHNVKILPVILSGGAGTRLWPVSRRQKPKQFLRMVTDEPLIVDTARRTEDSARFLPPVFVANDEHRFMIAEAMREAGMPHGPIVLEPEAKNTAAPVAAAALLAQRTHTDQLVLVLPSDHVIQDLNAFDSALDRGVDAAMAGYLTVFGIEPNRPDTGYGYIQSGNPLVSDGVANVVATFTEKPTLSRAEEMLAAGGWSWNSGMFLFRASDAIAAFDAYQPSLLAACRKSVAEAAADLDFLRLDPTAWSAIDPQPFDTAIMERTDKAAVVPVDMGWNDIGTWDALAEIGDKDATGNVTSSNTVAVDIKGSQLHSQGPLIAALGIENLTVVATSDAILVMPNDRAQDVRLLVEKMGDEGRDELDGSAIGYRPWGYYEEIDSGPGFKVKRLVVNPGQTLSRQMHHRRAEHWVVVSGTAHVLRGDEELVIEQNQSIYIPVETIHRLANHGDLPLQVIEVQTGDYLEEDDIVRFDDVYGRV